MSKMHEILLSKYPNSTQQDLDNFSRDVRQVESSGGTNLVNPTSSARGDFQFLTEGDGNAFQTAINRLTNTYTAEGVSIPDWVNSARENNNPMLLPYENQEELMLANIYQQKGSDSLLSKAFSGDRDSALEAYYKFHHTDPDDATRVAAEAAFTRVSPQQQEAQVPQQIQQVPETFEQQVLEQGLPEKEAIPQVDAGFLSPVDDFISGLFGGDKSGKPKKEVTEMIPEPHKDIFTSFWDAITGD